MRLFVAVKPPRYVIEVVEELKSRLRKIDGDIRYTKPDNLHTTLAFIGEVDKEELNRIEKGIEECVGRDPFGVSLSKAGAFPSIDNPRVLWVGDYNDDFAHLSMSIRTALGITDKTRPVCHLTVARMRGMSRGKIMRLIKASEDFLSLRDVKFMVDRVLLFESFLKKSGAEYSVLGEFELKGEKNG